MKKRCLYILLGTLMILGCAGMGTKIKMSNFEDISDAYAQAIRWSDFEKARRFIQASGAGACSSDLNKLKPVKVTSYDVKETVLSEDQSQILQIIEITYYRIDNNVEKTLKTQAIWESDQMGRSWYLTSCLPDFD